MRDQLRVCGVCETAVDDAVLILSELLSNACRHGRPLPELAGSEDVLASWRVDPSGRLTVEVTDGGGPTRPVPAKPSITARGGRGLNIITALADDWGVRDGVHGTVTVWVVVRLDIDPDRARDGQAPAAGPDGAEGNGAEPLSRPRAPHGPDTGRTPAVGAPAPRRTSGTAAAVPSHRPGHGHGHGHGQSHPPGHRHTAELAVRHGSELAIRSMFGPFPLFHDDRG